jgi:ubiquinone/menaquinone biosynthesis C-methylase UbiE
MSDMKDNPVSTAYVGQTAEQYDVKRFTTKQELLFAKFELEQLENAITDLPREASVLEIGCGTARFSQYLAQRGYAVLATDPSLDMLRVTRNRCAGLDNIKFEQQEGANLSYSNSTFDFVFAIRVTNQTESTEYALKMMKEMIRVTKPGGQILVEFVNSKRPFKKKSRSVRLSFEKIAEVASKNRCRIEEEKGILVFSQTVLNRIPDSLLGFWALIERVSSWIFWGWASRGYVLLKKEYAEEKL